MPEPHDEVRTPADDPGPYAPTGEEPPAVTEKAGLFRRLARRARGAGERVVLSAIDRFIGASKRESEEALPPEGTEPAKPSESPVEAERRLGILHGVTMRLRGAADEYIAAKLDEIEARVDVKLDEVEKRIDEKIVELHEQVRKLRDEELRHRLRILKITLIFTVLVAALSVGYKLLVRAMAG
jgi:hypothetical protein